MLRHGFAFGFVVLALGAAAAQPPVEAERYPAAPELPGVVVGQAIGGKPASTLIAIDDVKPVNPLPAEPSTLPVPPKDLPIQRPIEMPQSAVLGKNCPAPSAGCQPNCNSGCLDRIANWITFRSRAKQQCIYPTPYCPPLHAWFPCEPRNGSCNANPSCNANCRTATPVIVPPQTETLPPAKGAPDSKTPFIPPAMTQIPPTTIGSESELPPGFQHVDVGLKFTPGAAPMAKPTTQTEKVSSWRPK